MPLPPPTSPRCGRQIEGDLRHGSGTRPRLDALRRRLEVNAVPLLAGRLRDECGMGIVETMFAIAIMAVASAFCCVAVRTCPAVKVCLVAILKLS